jgi:hypothetical protein
MTQESLPPSTSSHQATPIQQEKSQQEKLLAEILHSVKASEQHLQQLNSHKLITAYNSTPHLLWMQFLKGGAFGLGSVAGAGIIVSIIAYLLSKIEFLPIIGEWVKIILQEINR